MSIMCRRRRAVPFREPVAGAQDGLGFVWCVTGTKSSATASRTKFLETNHIEPVCGFLMGNRVTTSNRLSEVSSAS